MSLMTNWESSDTQIVAVRLLRKITHGELYTERMSAWIGADEKLYVHSGMYKKGFPGDPIQHESLSGLSRDEALKLANFIWNYYGT